MAKSGSKNRDWVTFAKDPKTGEITMTRRNDLECISIRTTFADEAGVRLYQNANDDEGLFLDYFDVQWLSQALPELLNEMERAGLGD